MTEIKDTQTKNMDKLRLFDGSGSPLEARGPGVGISPDSQ
jgi:hypothetical protein